MGLSGVDRVLAFMVARELRALLQLVEQTAREPAATSGGGSSGSSGASARGWLDDCAAELQPVENRVTAPALKLYQSKLARGIRLWPSLLDALLKALAIPHLIFYCEDTFSGRF